ncbi:MAG: hypothetical protein ACI3YW_02355, partial [Candidatus Egerieousia sp.]
MLTIKKLIVIAIAILFAISSAAQNIKKAEWSKVKMDSSWESLAEQGKESKSTKIINKYKPAVDPTFPHQYITRLCFLVPG